MRNPKVLEKFFLTSTGEKLLQGAGPVSHDKAVEKATGEYRKCGSDVPVPLTRDANGCQKGDASLEVTTQKPLE